MDTVLIKACEVGHYDVMLLSYGFVNAEEGERILAACKEKNVGTTIMKSATGLMEASLLGCGPRVPPIRLRGSPNL